LVQDQSTLNFSCFMCREVLARAHEESKNLLPGT
jgi:hypothetical protein